MFIQVTSLCFRLRSPSCLFVLRRVYLLFFSQIDKNFTNSYMRIIWALQFNPESMINDRQSYFHNTSSQNTAYFTYVLNENKVTTPIVCHTHC